MSFGADDPAAVAHFDEYGWVRIDVLDTDGASQLQRWVEEVASWPAGGGGWLHYEELTDDGPKLCRSENVVPFHAGLATLLTSGPMLTVASRLLHEPAVLYKDKVNYKLAGGAGYSPHQDAPAYRFVDVHVTCMLAVDDATVDNGCLEVASGAHDEVLPTDERGCIRADVVATLEWTPMPLRAGEALWFHSRAPHRSGANGTATNRRAIYPTYNAASAGDLRTAYYDQRLAELAAAADGDRVPVSLIGDFEGRPVR